MASLQYEGAGAIERVGAADQIVAGDDAGDVGGVVVLADEPRTRPPVVGDAWPQSILSPASICAGLIKSVEHRQAATSCPAGRDDDRVGIVRVLRHGSGWMAASRAG